MPAAHQLPAEQLSFFKPPTQRRDAKEPIGPRQTTLGCQGWLKAERASDGAAGSPASLGFVEPSLETLLLLNSKHVDILTPSPSGAGVWCRGGEDGEVPSLFPW